MHQHLDAIKAAVGGAFAVSSWIGGKLAQLTDFPDIVKAADTPLIVGGLSYGVFHLWRELKASNAARIADQKAANDARIADQTNFITVLRSDAAKAAESRETLVQATTEQTATLHQQTAAIEALRRTVEESRNKPLLQERDR